MKVSRRQLSKRDARGSMLFLCIAVLAMMLVITGVAFSFYLVVFSHKNLENHSEDLAMECARILNENDHGGKLNNLTGHSRELVYSARQLYYKTNCEEFKGLQGLAAQVVEQSREGARLLKDERSRYSAYSVQRMKDAVKKAESNQRGLLLPTLTASGGKIAEVKVGDLGQPVSNVEISAGVPMLVAFDEQQFYIQKGKQIDLYKAKTNLKLPCEDNDLDFELASLPAPVRGNSAPLRLTRGAGFKPTTSIVGNGQEQRSNCSVIPSAVQIVMTMNVSQNMVGNYQSKTSTVNTACASGAFAEP